MKNDKLFDGPIENDSFQWKWIKVNSENNKKYGGLSLINLKKHSKE